MISHPAEPPIIRLASFPGYRTLKAAGATPSRPTGGDAPGSGPERHRIGNLCNVRFFHNVLIIATKMVNE